MTDEKIEILKQEGYEIVTQFLFIKKVEEDDITKKGLSRILYDPKEEKFGVETNGLFIRKPEEWRAYLSELKEVIALAEILNK